MKILGFISITLVLILGCATERQIYTPDGQRGYHINCGGTANNWGTCYEKAGEICGHRGYEILDKSTEHGHMTSVTQWGVYSSPTIERNITIKCK